MCWMNIQRYLLYSFVTIWFVFGVADLEDCYISWSDLLDNYQSANSRRVVFHRVHSDCGILYSDYFWCIIKIKQQQWIQKYSDCCWRRALRIRKGIRRIRLWIFGDDIFNFVPKLSGSMCLWWLYYTSRLSMGFICYSRVTLGSCHLPSVSNWKHIFELNYLVNIGRFFFCALKIVMGYAYMGSVGVTGGAHRLWSHRSYKATWQMRLILVIFNSMVFQNCIHEWVRDHRWVYNRVQRK